MKRLLLATVLLCASALAQNFRNDGIALGPKGPIPNATVAFCSQPANISTQPCSPLLALCSSLSDVGCTSPNPVTADGLGNYHAYIKNASVPYTLQIYGPQVSGQFVSVDQGVATSNAGNPASPSGSIQGNNAGVFGSIPNVSYNLVTGAITTTAPFNANFGGNFSGSFSGNPLFTGTPGFSTLTQGKGTSVLSNSALGSFGQSFYCDAFPGGADNAVNIQNCINAQGAVAMGVVDATGLTSTSVTVNNPIIPTTVTPKGITVRLGGGTIITNVPQLLNNKVELYGLGAQGATGLGMTTFQAGPNFPLACNSGTVAGQASAACLGTVNTTITPGGVLNGCLVSQPLIINGVCTSTVTSITISGSVATAWSTGANTQILQPGCRVAVGTFSSEGLLTNGYWGIVQGGTTPANHSFVMGKPTVNGTGSASGTATFAKYCNVIEDGDGTVVPEFAIGLDHIGIDTQDKDGVGCWGDLYSQEKTYLNFIQCRTFNDAIGLDVEGTSAINIGPFLNIDTINGANASANSIDIYDAVSGSRAVWRGGTHNHLQPSGCTTPQNYFVILEDSTLEWSQHHQEGCGAASSIAVQIGQDPVNILAPVFFVFGDVNCHSCFIHNNNIGSNASGSGIKTMFRVGSSGHAQDAVTIANNASNGNVTNMLIDNAPNGANTITAACNGSFLGHYTTDTNGVPTADTPVACINRASTIDFDNGVVYAPYGFAPPVIPIASIFACNSTVEGIHAVATTCNAACTVGGTCTTGGTTHCELYCNGTAYFETGR